MQSPDALKWGRSGGEWATLFKARLRKLSLSKHSPFLEENRDRRISWPINLCYILLNLSIWIICPFWQIIPLTKDLTVVAVFCFEPQSLVTSRGTENCAWFGDGGRGVYLNCSSLPRGRSTTSGETQERPKVLVVISYWLISLNSKRPGRHRGVDGKRTDGQIINQNSWV